jgi:transposase
MQEERWQQRDEAERFYRELAGPPVRVGMEACGHYPWFERRLEELGFELWWGDAAEVRASVVRKQKTDRRDAEHLMHLLIEDRFPKIWVPSLEVRDVVREPWTYGQLSPAVMPVSPSHSVAGKQKPSA